MNRKFTAIFALVIFIAPLAWAQHTITTVAGGGPSSVPLSAAIYNPDAVFKDGSGNLYIAATGANAVYKIDSTGKLTTIAGTGTAGFSGEGGPATSAQLDAPTEVFVDGHGNIFIADANNNVIREIVAATGNFKTVAGIPGFAAYNGDGIAATAAELNGPTGVSVDGSGNIFIAEINGCRVREVVAATGDIQTVAGTTGAGIPGPEPSGNCGYNGNSIAANTAKLNGPSAVVLDSSGNLFLTDQGNYCVRKVATTGQITDVAGTCTVLLAPGGADGDGGAATSALFQRPVRLFVDGHENVYISDIADNRMREVVASTGNIQTVAGTGTAGFTGDDALATQAELDQPSGVWVDASGNIFLTDSLNNRVREVTASNGFIQTIAGDGSGDGDGGPATSGLLDAPYGVAVDETGNLFIADTADSVIREAVAATGNITTVAGTFTAGFDGDGLAINVDLNNPNGVFVDGSGDIFIADSQNNAIREVNSDGSMTTVVGESDGVLTNVLNYPTAVFVDGSGNIFIADSGNNVIEKVAAVVVEGTPALTVVAGTGTAGFTGNGGLATKAELNAPSGVFVDSSGNIFIADSLNNVVREVVAATGNIETVAGNGTAGFSGDTGPATSAQLDYPFGVFVDSSGNIFIGDSNNNAVREVLAATGNIRSVAGSSGNAGFSGDGGPAANAELNYPAGVFGDNQSNLYVADPGNSRIRKIAGIVTGAPANITASGGTPQSAAVNTPFATPLSATVTDAFGNLVAGVTVTFIAPETGASSNFGDGMIRVTATTNPAGVATSPSFSANCAVGSYTVTASVSGVETPASFLLTNNPGSPASITATGGTPQGTPIKSPFTIPLAATVMDACSNPLAAVNVAFAAPVTGASGTFAGGSATSPPEPTNAQGIATAPTFTANLTQGSYNVTAAVAGVALPANFALTNQPPPPLTITTAALPGGQIGVAYSALLTPGGGLAPYSWSISTGALPAGLTLNAATGAISGTPSAVGTSNFTVKVTDSEVPAVSQTANLSITIIGNLATLQVLPNPSTVGYSASVQFYAQDAFSNPISVTWSISPATGEGTISAAGLYQAPAAGSGTIKVTATSVADATKQSSVSFALASNGLSACCTLPQQMTATAGSTSTPTGVQLDGVPNTSTVPFTLSCAGLPVGAACAFTLPTKLGGGPTQVISGSSPAAFCYVTTTGPGGTAAGTGGPLSPPSNPLPNSPLNVFVTFGAGLLVLALAAWRTPKTMPRWKLAFMSIALVCVTVAVMGACSGFSPGNVPLPNSQVTSAGTYQIQILATPSSGSGFVQTQLIVPLTVH